MQEPTHLPEKQREKQNEPPAHLFHQDSFPLNAVFVNAVNSQRSRAAMANTAPCSPLRCVSFQTWPLDMGERVGFG